MIRYIDYDIYIDICGILTEMKDVTGMSPYLTAVEPLQRQAHMPPICAPGPI